jgi:ABC-type phosphate transport system permease subunit
MAGLEVVVHETDPLVPTRQWRRLGTALAGIPGIVVGWYALGVAAVVVAVVVVATLILLIWSGPRINLRLYGTSPSGRSLLHACAAVERRSGTLDVERSVLRWTP